MKRTLGILLITVAMNVALGGMAGLHAQQIPAVGGYQIASMTEPDVMSAARYAVKKEKKRRGGNVSLVSIEQAETQVVAGINYRLCLRVKIKGRVRSVTTVVYRNLEKMYSLTSWKQRACETESPQ